MKNYKDLIKQMSFKDYKANRINLHIHSNYSDGLASFEEIEKQAVQIKRYKHFSITDHNTVQGYILNDKGEIMQGTKPISADLYQETALKGGALDIPTTNIKMWIDPNNGKYLGKYDEYEIKKDGTIVGKAENGKKVVPLYRITTRNFHNAAGLYEYKDGLFLETEESGKPVLGCGEIRSGLLELSNADFKGNISYYQMAKVQMEVVNKLISSNKDLLQQAMQMVSSS